MARFSFFAIPVLIAGIVCTGDGRAQIAKDIPPGTPGEGVIRVYGWPKGRSAMGEREIWTYESFQVTLERNLVTSVSAMPPLPKVIPRPAPNQITPVRPANSATPPRQFIRSTPTTAQPVAGSSPPTVTRSQTVIRVPSKLTQAPSPNPPLIPEAEKAPSPPPAPNLLGLKLASLFIILGALAAIIAKGRAELRRDALRRKSQENPTPPAGTTPQTWQEEIAERLRSTQAPPATESPLPTSFTSQLIRELEWKRYELVIELYFNATGVQAKPTSIGADGGIDVKLNRVGEAQPFSYVQCKAWGRELIGVSLMRELFGAMAADRIREGVFATTSDFTPDARAFANANQITLITTQDLVERLNRLPPADQNRIMSQVTSGDYTTPTCPNCDRKMVWKEKAGFWGCPRYPACRSSPIYPRTRASV